MAVAIDFETYLIDENNPWPKPVCLSWADGQDTGLETGKDMENALHRMLRSGDTIIAHNASFECNVIFTHFPQLNQLLTEAINKNKIYCTQIAEQLIDNTREKKIWKYSLADLVQYYYDKDISAGKTDPDAWRLRYSELDGIPVKQWPKEAVEYAINDSIFAFDVYTDQETEGLVVSIYESIQASIYLNMMGSRGILVDNDRVNLLHQELQNHLHPMYEELIEQGLCTASLNGKKPKKNVKQFREYVVKHVPEELLQYTPGGAVSVSSPALQDYSRFIEDKNMRTFINVSVYEKALTAFVYNLQKGVDAQGIVRSSYSATKSTGRTSSSGSKLYPSVNIQQMPREVPNVTWDVRNCFIPRPGYKIVSIDYAGLELASTAHQLKKVYGGSKMLDRINSGTEPVDMHSALAYQIRNMTGKYPPCTYEEFVANKKQETYKEFRQLAKPINLGFPGGIGYDTMRKLLIRDGAMTHYKIIDRSTSQDRLKRIWYRLRQEFPNLRVARVNKKEYALVDDELVHLKRVLFQAYPELQYFLTSTHKKSLTGETKPMKNDYNEWELEPMYQYDIYGFKRDWCTYTAFCNGFLMQTPSAIGAKRAMCDIIQFYMNDDRMNPLAFIHDEIVFEVLDNSDQYDIIEDVSSRMIDNMQTVLNSVRITVEAEIMPYWMKAGGEWSKTYWKDPKDNSLHTYKETQNVTSRAL